MDCSLPGSSVYGILQERILEWVAMPSPGDLFNPGIKHASFTSPSLGGRFLTTSTTWEVPILGYSLTTPGCLSFFTIFHSPQIGPKRHIRENMQSRSKNVPAERKWRVQRSFRPSLTNDEIRRKRWVQTHLCLIIHTHNYTHTHTHTHTHTSKKVTLQIIPCIHQSQSVQQYYSSLTYAGIKTQRS